MRIATMALAALMLCGALTTAAQAQPWGYHHHWHHHHWWHHHHHHHW
jgi:Spy/CpxP family protein refolding chaperone